MPLVVNSRSRYARRLASVLSRPPDLKRFSQVPLDSSAASSPLPLATMAAAVLERRWVSMQILLLGSAQFGTGGRNSGEGSILPAPASTVRSRFGAARGT